MSSLNGTTVQNGEKQVIISHAKLNFHMGKTLQRLKKNLIKAELIALIEFNELLFEGPNPNSRSELLENLAHLITILQLSEREQIREKIYNNDYDKAVDILYSHLFD